VNLREGLVGEKYANYHKPTDMAKGQQEGPPPKRRLLTRWDIFWLIIVAVIILYVVLQQFGVDLIYQERTEELRHRPHGD
jgi:hypothetical protein